MADQPPAYRSYLLRLWRAHEHDEQQANGAAPKAPEESE